MKTAFPSPRGPRYEHVVFHQRQRGRRVNFAPAFDAGGIDAFAATTQGTHEQAFLRWLFEQADLDADSYRPETLRRRMGACLRALRVASIDEARQLLLREPSKVAPAIETIVIGVTSFFRDTDLFDHLTDMVLPALPKRRRRIWSAGCSNGDELYSVAMLLAEMDLLSGAELLGTDCRASAVAHARKGVFANAAVRDVPAQLREKYFAPLEAGFRVAPVLRKAAQWRVADVTRVREPGSWDLILCRNLAMYLRSAATGKLWQALEEMLRPGGFLVLGKAERPVGSRHLAAVAPCIYRKG